MKKLFSLVLSVCLCAATATAGAATVITDDRGVFLEGNMLLARKGSSITVTVVDKSSDWLDEETWSQNDITGEKLVYYNVIKAGADGEYKISFVPEENGSFLVYLGNSEYEKPEILEISYINKSKNEAAITEIIAPEADISEILKSKHKELGFFGKLFYDTVLDNDGNFIDEKLDELAEIIDGELNGVSTGDMDKVIKIGDKAMLMMLLKGNYVSDINAYADNLYIDDLQLTDYYNDEIAENVTKYLNGKNFENIAEYDSELKKSIILSNINNNSSFGQIKDLLSEFSDELGIEKEHDLDDLTSDIMKHDDFKDLDAVKKYIKSVDIDEDSGSGSSGGKGNGGGGVTTIKPGAYSGAIAVGDSNSSAADKIVAFEDIANVPWAEEAITSLYLKGVLDGKSQGIFAPNDTVTREEFVKMLTAAFKMNMIDDDFPFEDVSEEHWSYQYVKTAYLAGICNGVTANSFGLGQNIKRQDVCVMLINATTASDYKLPEGVPSEFKDANNIADYAKEAVAKISAAGVVNGDENGYFNPNNYTTRAEAAKMIFYVISTMKNL